jgi:hypothetical protein
VWGFFSNLWYWLRCHTFDKYHLVDIRTPEYRWGWMDRCDGVLYACFALLVDFVEKEGGLPVESEDLLWAAAGREAQLLYAWWKWQRAEEHRQCRDPDMQLLLEQKDQAMLLRLVAVRQYLWT